MTLSAVVLGGGMMGQAMARDLAADPEFDVTVIDARPDALERLSADGIGCRQLDLSEPGAVQAAVADFDVVCGALSSALGFQTLTAVIEAGKPYADLAFMAEDALDLDDLARERGVCAVVDMGVAPGVSNLIIGDAIRRFEAVDRLEIYVGGLPVERSWPYEYKAAFAPADAIEEYTRPSRIVENGQVVVRPALSEPELLHFPGVGTLEAFNTDGLRSLTRLSIPNMVEKTLRYPGHRALMEVMRETGLFSRVPITLPDGTRVRPLDVTSALLFPKWIYQEGQEDLTLFRLSVEGLLEGRKQRLSYDLLDRYDSITHTTSMARTTAFPCAIMARMLARGEISKPGVHPPEILGQMEGLWLKVRAALASRHVHYQERVEDV